MLDSLLRSWGKLVVAVGTMGVAFALSPAAHAATINFASFSIGGSFSLPAGMHLGNTDTIFIGNGGSITVTQGDVGDLAGIVNDGDTGTLADLPSLSSFAPIGGYLSLGGGVSLDLNSIQITDRSGPTPGLIEILGDGVVHAPGYDPTDATVTFTGASDTDGDTFVVAVQTVPEPLPIALLGLGLVGLFLNRRITARVNIHAIA